MNSHKTEGRGSPLGNSYRGTREQRLAKKEARKSSWKWPLLFQYHFKLQERYKVVEEN